MAKVTVNPRLAVEATPEGVAIDIQHTIEELAALAMVFVQVHAGTIDISEVRTGIILRSPAAVDALIAELRAAKAVMQHGGRSPN